MIWGFDFCLRTDGRCYGSMQTIVFSYSLSSFIKSAISYSLGTGMGQAWNTREVFQVTRAPSTAVEEHVLQSTDRGLQRTETAERSLTLYPRNKRHKMCQVGISRARSSPSSQGVLGSF